VINAERTALAVGYLAEHTAGTRMVYDLHRIQASCGSLSPDVALQQIREWVQNDCITECFSAETASWYWFLKTLVGPGWII
jgi:hypothetical protein